MLRHANETGYEEIDFHLHVRVGNMRMPPDGSGRSGDVRIAFAAFGGLCRGDVPSVGRDACRRCGRRTRGVEALDELYAAVFGPEARPPRADAGADGAVHFSGCDAMEPEAYRLTVAPDRIDIVSGAPAGAFYAVQTLGQLRPKAARFPASRSRTARASPIGG